jgi:hypothetical protein
VSLHGAARINGDTQEHENQHEINSQQKNRSSRKRKFARSTQFFSSLLGHFPHRFLTIAQWFVHLSAYPQPMQQHRQLSSHGHHGSLLGIFSSSLRKL